MLIKTVWSHPRWTEALPEREREKERERERERVYHDESILNKNHRCVIGDA